MKGGITGCCQREELREWGKERMASYKARERGLNSPQHAKDVWDCLRFASLGKGASRVGDCDRAARVPDG